MKITFALYSLFSFLLSLELSKCFHEIPHMLVLGVAKRELMKVDMEIFNITAHYFDYFSKNDIDSVSTTSYEENAVWADDIKQYGDAQDAWGMWHFIGNWDNNPQNLKMKKEPMADSENALDAYNNIVKVLTHKKFVGNVTEFKIQMLKMLVHLVGDIHMPHHTGSFYNSSNLNPEGFSLGDRGGNKQKITFITESGKKEKTDIHFFFDSACFYYNWKNRLDRPLNSSFSMYFENELDRLMALYPKGTLSINTNEDFKDWAEESWKVALDEVYPFLMAKKEVKFGDDFYLKSFAMTQKRIVLGGYRLAYTLQKLFKEEKGKHAFFKYLSYDNKFLRKYVEEENNNLNESPESRSNKIIAIVFGVLFGISLFSLIYIFIYFKKTASLIDQNFKQKAKQIQKIYTENNTLQA